MNYKIWLTGLTGFCILADKYAAKWLAPDVYIKPEFELLWLLILALVVTESAKNKYRVFVIFSILLVIITVISVYKIYVFQV